MIPIPFVLTMACTAGLPPTPPPPVNSAQVTVEGPYMLSPRLPGSLAEARAHYPSVQNQLKRDLEDAEQALRELYRLQPTGAEVKPGTLQVPRSEADRVRAILVILQDPDFARLEHEVLSQREAWRKDIQGEGRDSRGRAAAPEAATGTGPARVDPSVLEARARRIAQAKAILYASAEYDPKTVALNPETQYLRPQGKHQQGVSRDFTDAMTVANLNMSHDAALRVASAQVTRDHMQGMSVPFDALVAKLEGTFLEASDLLEASQETSLSDSTHSLERALKIMLLERLRNCLWFSWSVWADLATQPHPAPLARLAPGPRLPPAAASRN